MRRILVKSLNEAFDFVMDHYYPAGCGGGRKRKIHMQSFQFRILTRVVLVSPLQKINFVKGVLTLYFDDVGEGNKKVAVLFDENMADSVYRIYSQSYGCRYAVNSLLCRTVKIACNRSICEKNDGKRAIKHIFRQISFGQAHQMSMFIICWRMLGLEICWDESYR